MRRINYRRRMFTCIVVFVAIFSFVMLRRSGGGETEVEAADLTKFDPGYIMSDYQMGNYNSMTEAEIQAWLTSKNSCPNTDYDLYLRLSASTSVATWHFANGHFVCISEELFGDGEVIGSGETAAHIIWQAAQDYHINPQVLLVLLQKENSLITDDLPNSWNYRTATGYGCPDTAACSSKYYGFKNQIRNAAALFHEVLSGGWTNYPLGENWVRFSPHCDSGTVVNIRSLATSALYRYTPYQPNAAALSVGYGTVPGSSYETCAAYGNRNFYSFFEDWFGGITDDFDIDSLESARIPDGIYSIMNMNSRKMMDVNGGVESATVGTIIHAWNNNNTDAQKWRINNNNDGTFTIVNPVLELVLGDNNGLVLEEYKNQCSQKWKILKYDNSYIISTTCSGAVLQNSLLSGDLITIDDAVKSDIIKWQIDLIDIDMEEGEYIVESVLDSNKGLNILDNAYVVEKGSNVGLTTLPDGKERIWKIVKNNDATYSFHDLNSGLVVDVAGGDTKKGTNVRMWTKNESCAQKWKIAQSDDLYVFISVCSDLVMDVDGGLPSENANVHLWWFNNTSAQKWQMKRIEKQVSSDDVVLADGKYIIKSKIDVNKAIDIDGGAESASDGENIQLWRSNGTNAQIWNVVYNESDGTYSIINAYTGKAIDVDGAKTVRGTNIQLWNSNNTCAQKWYIVKEEDYFIVTSACSELVLDVSGGKADFGANINLWTTNGTDAQKWFFEPINS